MSGMGGGLLGERVNSLAEFIYFSRYIRSSPSQAVFSAFYFEI